MGGELLKMRSILLAALLAALHAPVVTAQSVLPTNNILPRVLMIESQYGRATTFSIDVDSREYWITAKHVLTGAKHPPYGSLPSRSASLRILNPGGEGEEWLAVDFSVVDAGNDIDIVVLAAPAPLLTNPPSSEGGSSVGVALGGECAFLGFPYGGGMARAIRRGEVLDAIHKALHRLCSLR